MTTPDAYWEEAHAAFHRLADADAQIWAEPVPEPEPADQPAPFTLTARAEAELTAEPDPEAGLGHDYDGPELRSGTPEYEALYAEYQAWAEPEAEL